LRKGKLNSKLSFTIEADSLGLYSARIYDVSNSFTTGRKECAVDSSWCVIWRIWWVIVSISSWPV